MFRSEKPKKKRQLWVKLHRVLSWLLVVSSILTIATGYADSRKLVENLALATQLHRIFEWSFMSILSIHIILSIKFGRIKWKRTLSVIKKKKGLDFHLVRVLQRISSWFILIFGFLVIFSGITEYEWYPLSFGEHPLSIHRLFDLALSLFIIFHVGAGMRFFLMRKRVTKKKALICAGIIMIILLIPIIIIEVVYPGGSRGGGGGSGGGGGIGLHTGL